MFESVPSLHLTDAHLKRLKVESGLSDEVIAARQYQSVGIDHMASYQDAGFPLLAKSLPGLEIPIWTTEGKSPVLQLRPDTPPVYQGKPRKYLWPDGELIKLDVNPLILERVRSGHEPLVITEGVIKADSAVSRGMVCIGLIGVYGFRGRNAQGGVTALADWENVSLAGRQVYIAFDSDVSVKPEVRKAMMRFANFLSSKGAIAHTVFLPNGPNGEKVGLDDFFVAGNTVENFWALTNTTLADVSGSHVAINGPRYEVVDGRICQLRQGDAGTEAHPLCDFTATILSIETLDELVSSRQYYIVSGATHLGEPLPTCRVPANEFEGMGWIAEYWAGRASIMPGRGAKDILRHAILDLSRRTSEIPRKTTYSHTGWRNIDEKWYYLSSAGGLGELGLRTDIDVQPEGPLKDIRIGGSSSNDIVNGAKAVISLLDLGPLEAMAPLVATALYAPLVELMPPRFVTHLVGRTSSFKTEVCGLLQSFFGPRFSAANLPGSWSSTANYMERQASMAKDALLVMDDFKPSGGSSAIRGYHLKADQFIRNFANSTGRGRLNSDASARETFIATGVVLSTGEDTPAGESLRSRLVIVDIEKGDISSEKLTIAQEKRRRGLYSAAMDGYLQWLASRLDEMRPRMQSRHDELMQELRESGTITNRTPDLAAKLMIALEFFFEYIEEMALVRADIVSSILEKCRAALMSAMTASSRQLLSENPSRITMRILADSLAANRCHLQGLNMLGFVDGLERFGWILSDDGKRRPGGEMIGYADLVNRKVYLRPSLAYAFIRRESERSTPISSTQSVWIRDLMGAKLIESFGKSGTIKLPTQNGATDLMCIRFEEIDFGDPRPVGADDFSEF